MGPPRSWACKSPTQRAEEVGHHLPCPALHTGTGLRPGGSAEGSRCRAGGRTRGLNFSANFGALVLPEGDLAVVAAGGQQARLLRVPGHAVDVLRVRPGHVGGQAESGLPRVGGRALLEDPDGVVAASRRQRPGEVAPRAGTAPGASPMLPKGRKRSRVALLPPPPPSTHHATS